jgi:uncharacterized protein (DUF427 family)
MQAVWNGAVLAESDNIETVEGNAYFPADALDPERVRPSMRRTTCPWKGEAHYYDVVVDGQVNEGAVWFYPEPKAGAEAVRDRVAFWKGVVVK